MAAYRLFDSSAPSALESVTTGVLRSIRETPTSLNMTFFSQANVDLVQALLRDAIKKRTGYVIDRQSDEAVIAVLRNVYVQYSTRDSDSDGAVRAEVERLNGLVLRELVPSVGAGLQQYLGYLKDASTLPEPMARGERTSIRGENTTFTLFRGL